MADTARDRRTSGKNLDARAIRTPDQRLRVFISSTLDELASERAAARETIAQLRLAPVMFEHGARPHPPRELYRAYLEQSHVFVGIYWQRYGWVAPDMGVSGLEDEFQLSAGKPRLLYVKTPAPEREPGLEAMIRRLEEEGLASYKLFKTPEELAALLADDLAQLLSERFETGALVAPLHAPTNLPIPVTSFVGRSRELAELRGFLETRHLVTLVGAGGAGKTRLALEMASRLLDEYPDGVWFVELAPISDQSLVSQTVAKVLGVKEESGKASLQTLAEGLSDKRLLLLLDNCEHMLDACATLADALIRQCPHVKILATSREALGITGEQAHRVPSLSLPNPNEKQTPETLSRYEAAQLFVDRARLARPEFQPTPENAASLASLCFHLDGIPLAIELAAARASSLSVGEIEGRLDQRFRLLTGGSRTALPRQQTLRALIDWSYDLLGAREKSLLQRLSVFVGGWTLRSAESVCAGDGVEEGDVLDLLTSLADKSLVFPEPQQRGTRYRLLETVRQYALDRLLESGAVGTWRDRHLAQFLGLAEEAESQLMGPDQQAWLERLESEHDNLRAALEWGCDPSGDSESALRLAGALWRFWYVHGHLVEGRVRLARALALPAGGDAGARAKALNGAGILASNQGDCPAAREFYEESLAIRRELGDKKGIAGSLSNLGILAKDLCDHPAARTLFEDSLTILRELGEQWGVSALLNNLGRVAVAQGDFPAAQALFEEGLAIKRELGDPGGVAQSLGNLCEVAYEQGDLPTARTLGQESLAIQSELGDRVGIARSLEELASMASAQGAVDKAALIWGAAERLREDIGALLPLNERPRYERHVSAAREARADDVAFDHTWQQGRVLALERAIELALEKPEA